MRFTGSPASIAGTKSSEFPDRAASNMRSANASVSAGRSFMSGLGVSLVESD